MIDRVSSSDRGLLARAGLLGLIASVGQVLASLSAVGFLSGAFDDIDYVAGFVAFWFFLVVFVSVLCAMPGVVAALFVWRSGRGRIALLLLVVIYFAWHVAGVLSLAGWVLSGARALFQLPFGSAVDIAYQAAMVCLLAVVGVLLTVAPRSRVAVARVPFAPPPAPVGGDGRTEGPEPGAGAPKHLRPGRR